MRNCPRCNTTMVEDLELRTNDGLGICVSQKGLFGSAVGKVSCAVCPECGYTESYLENTDKVKKLANK